MKKAKSSSFLAGDKSDSLETEMSKNEEFLLHQIHKLKSEVTELRGIVESLEHDQKLWPLRVTKMSVIASNLICAGLVFAYRLSNDLQHKYQSVTIRRVLLDRKRVASEAPLFIYNATLRATSQSLIFAICAYLLKKRQSQWRNFGFVLSILASAYLYRLPRFRQWPIYLNIVANIAHVAMRFAYFLPRIVNSAPGL